MPGTPELKAIRRKFGLLGREDALLSLKVGSSCGLFAVKPGMNGQVIGDWFLFSTTLRSSFWRGHRHCSVTGYEVLDYDATLTLGDTKGIKADFQRTETVRFLQSGIAGILDHVWGDGVALTYYHNEAGNLEDSFNDQGRRHLVMA